MTTPTILRAATQDPGTDSNSGTGVPEIGIDWNFFPWMGSLTQAIAGMRALGLAVCIMSLVLCGIVWGVGHAFDLGHYGNQAKIGIMVVCIVAALIGGAVAIIDFFASMGMGMGA